MSTYVREKVLRIPVSQVDYSSIRDQLLLKYADPYDDLEYYLEEEYPHLFEYATVGKFQMSPTVERYLDYVLEYEWDCDGSWGKVRDLTDAEREKYAPIFQQIDKNIDMNYVKLVEFCWYNSTEAPDYYDIIKDSFYEEV